MSRGRRFLVAVEAIVVVIAICLLAMGVGGYVLFTNAKVDELQRADAIIVLGGEHDGREDYGLSLARDHWAPTVVISNPYWPGDTVMQRVCRTAGDIEVTCRRPSPLTTRGEADMMRQLARERGWAKIIVISWRYHLPRARLIFRQCSPTILSRPSCWPYLGATVTHRSIGSSFTPTNSVASRKPSRWVNVRDLGIS